MNTFKTSLIATLLAATTASIAYAQAPADAPRGERGQKMQERLKAADTNGDGKVSRDEANASLPGIAKNFDAIDSNKDGFITMDELRAAGGKRGRGQQMQEHFKAADTNGDGKISREEANASLPHIAKNFDAIDTNKDGFITLDELRAAGGKHERAHQMFDHLKAADTNGDGMISREEANASLPRIAQHFDAIDTNKDGFITREEMRAFHEANGGRK